jgi:hypothetical protein
MKEAFSRFRFLEQLGGNSDFHLFYGICAVAAQRVSRQLSVISFDSGEPKRKLGK